MKAKTQDLEVELKKGGQAVVSTLERHLWNIKCLAPDILDVILVTLANPAAGFGMVTKNVAGKMKASAA